MLTTYIISELLASETALDFLFNSICNTCITSFRKKMDDLDIYPISQLSPITSRAFIINGSITELEVSFAIQGT
jgi:hypothetical protein